MPSLKICKEEWKKRGYESLRDCTDYRGKSKTSETQKAGTSAKEEQRRTRGALAEAHTSIRGPMEKMKKGKKGKGLRRIASKSY